MCQRRRSAFTQSDEKRPSFESVAKFCFGQPINFSTHNILDPSHSLSNPQGDLLIRVYTGDYLPAHIQMLLFRQGHDSFGYLLRAHISIIVHLAPIRQH